MFCVLLIYCPSISEMSKVQDDEVGDGTTSVAILASELLKEAEALVSRKIHPQTIVDGFRKATECAKQALKDSSLDHGLMRSPGR